MRLNDIIIEDIPKIELVPMLMGKIWVHRSVEGSDYRRISPSLTWRLAVSQGFHQNVAKHVGALGGFETPYAILFKSA